jgi:hypothetical protein
MKGADKKYKYETKKIGNQKLIYFALSHIPRPKLFTFVSRATDYMGGY